MEKNKLKAAIYCRLALADQIAIDRQKEDLRLLADQYGYNDLLYYMDNGESGHDFDRPAFLRMNTAIRAGEIEAVFIRDISRIGRDFIEVMMWTDQLEKQGVRLITAVE